MHVVMTVNAAWNIWNFRRPLVIALLAAGHKVTVLAPPDNSVADIMKLGCRFLPLEMNVKGLNPIEDLKLVARYRHFFRLERPDMVFSYTIKNNLFGAIAARACAIPFLPNVTGLGTAFLSGGLLQAAVERLYRYAFRGLRIVFFQNADDRDLFLVRKLVRPEQPRLLPGSGIDLAHFSPADYPDEAETPAFLMIARLLRDKGVMEYVDAARIIRQQTPTARFRLLGALGAENRTAIRRETVENWQAEGVIDYLGEVSDVRPHIAQAHCVVLPSYREGAPRTLIEAAAMARPLLATDVPGCRAVVEDGRTGYLCAPKNAVSLAAKCSTFLTLPHAAKRSMGQAGRVKMEAEYDEALVVAAYQQAMAELPMAQR